MFEAQVLGEDAGEVGNAAGHALCEQVCTCFLFPTISLGAGANTCFTAKHATPRTLVWLGIDIISSQYEKEFTLSMSVALILGVTDT